MVKECAVFFCIFGDVYGDNIRDPVANVGLIGSFFAGVSRPEGVRDFEYLQTQCTGRKSVSKKVRPNFDCTT